MANAISDLDATTVRLRLGTGTEPEDEIRIAEAYEIKMSVLQQPSAFSIRMGWGGIAAELFAKYPPNSPFTISIGDSSNAALVQSGVTDARAVPSGKFSQVEFRGRDFMARLFDSFIDTERSFSDPTYFGLTRKVMDLVGLQDHELVAGNEANRKLITGAKGGSAGKLTTTTKTFELPPKKAPPIVFNTARFKGLTLAQVAAISQANQVGNVFANLNHGVGDLTADPSASMSDIVSALPTGASGGTGTLVYTTLKAKLGARWYDFLQEQYKLAGLFLWAGGDGKFVLSRPNANQAAAYQITRVRGNSRDQTTIIDARHDDNTAQRHSKATVHGRTGKGKKGRNRFFGEFEDPEMIAFGFQKTIVEYDDDVKSDVEAEYLARRRIAEQRRSGWQLEYTVSGHRVESLFGQGLVVWAPDTIVRVDDEELNLHGEYYVEAVTFARSPETTTRLTLMRPEDLVFAEKLFPGEKAA